jgi:hypothetical protein
MTWLASRSSAAGRDDDEELQGKMAAKILIVIIVWAVRRGLGDPDQFHNVFWAISFLIGRDNFR